MFVSDVDCMSEIHSFDTHCSVLVSKCSYTSLPSACTEFGEAAKRLYIFVTYSNIEFFKVPMALNANIQLTSFEM